MTDDQFKELIKELKPETRSSAQKLLDNVLSTLVVSLVVGFFTVLYTTSRTADGQIKDLMLNTEKLRVTVAGMEKELIQELARLKAGQDQITTWHDGLEKQSAAIRELQESVVRLASRTNLPVATSSPPPAAIPLPATAPTFKPLVAFTNYNRDVFEQRTKAVESNLTQGIRDYEQKLMKK